MLLKRHSKLVGPIVVLVAAACLGACGLLMDDEQRLERARENFAARDYRSALLDLRTVLQNSPDNLQARLMLGDASFAVGDEAAALVEYEHAERLGAAPTQYALPLARSLAAVRRYARIPELPLEGYAGADRASFLALRGDAYLALGRPADALAEYSAALTTDSRNAAAQLGTVEVHLVQSDLGAAASALGRVVNASAPAVGFLTGRLELARGDSAAAERTLRGVLSGSDPARWQAADVPVVLVLVEALIMEGRSAEAVEAAEGLLRLDPGSPLVRYQRAQAAYEVGDYERAERELAEALRVAPSFLPARRLLGAVAYRRGDLETANMHLTSVLASSANDTSARRLLAEVRMRLGRPVEALTEVERGLGSAQTDVGLLALGAQASLQVGNVNDGIEYLQAALEADPSLSGLRIQLATVYVAAGRSANALAVLRGVADDDPNAFQRDVILALSEVADGGAEEALRRGRDLVAAWPAVPEARVFAASLARAAGRTDVARELLAEAVSLDPENVAANGLLARLAYQSGDLQAAERYFSTNLVREPANETVYLALAQVAAEQGRADDALTWLERGQAAAPRGALVRTELARQLLATGDSAAALATVSQALEIAPSSERALVVAAAVHLARGAPAEAVPFLERVASARNDAAWYRELAKAQMAAADSRGAERSLGRALQLDPRDVVAIIMLGQLDLSGGRSERALDRVRAAQALDPSNAAASMLSGNVWSSRGDLAQAESAYARSFAVQSTTPAAVALYRVRVELGRADAMAVLLERARAAPDDPDLLFALAVAYQTRGEGAAAVTQYRRLLELEPENGVAWNNLAWLYHSQGSGEAVPAARRALQLRPDDGAVIDTLGWLLTETGDSAGALPLLRRAAELLPAEGDVQYHLGAVLARTGAAGEARAVLERILATKVQFPSRPAAEELLRSL